MYRMLNTEYRSCCNRCLWNNDILDPLRIAFIPCLTARTKYMTRTIEGRKTLCLLAHSLRVQSTVGRNLKLSVTVHPKQIGGGGYTQFTVSFWFSSWPQFIYQCHLHPINLNQILLHKLALRFISTVIINLIYLMIKINQCRCSDSFKLAS